MGSGSCHKQYVSRVKIKPWVPGKTFPGDVVSCSRSEVGKPQLVSCCLILGKKKKKKSDRNTAMPFVFMYVASGCFQVAAGELSTCHRTVAEPKTCATWSFIENVPAYFKVRRMGGEVKRVACFNFFFKYMPLKSQNFSALSK